MKSRLKITTMWASLAAALAISACGGGGGGSAPSGSSGSTYSPVSVAIQSPGASVNSLGSSIQIVGTASTPNTKIASMAWSISGGAGATLVGADCAAANKNSTTYGTNNQNATGTSAWSCPVTVNTTASTAADASYTLTLTATDDKGSSQSTSIPLSFAASISAPITVAIQSPGASVNSLGSSLQVTGTANTPNTKIVSMNWTIAGSAGATLVGADCASASKNNAAPGTSGPNSTGPSSWSCPVTVNTTASSSSGASYTLTLTIVDDKGSSQSATIPLTFAAATSAPITVAIQSPGAGVNNLGSSVQVTGTANTPNTKIVSMNWTIAGSTGATLANADCTSASKNNAAPGTNGATSTGPSSWSCPVTVNTTALSSSGASYTLSLTIVDDKGSSQSASIPLSFAAATSPPITVAIQSPGAVVNNLGTSVQVTGTANTPNTKILSMNWTVAGAAGATLVNADCTSASKNNTAPGTNGPTSTGPSSWSCPVTLNTAASTVAGANYTLTVTVIDDKGNTQSMSLPLAFAATPAAVANVIIVNAGNSFSANSGSTNALHCVASGGTVPYSYQWVVSNNGGYSLSLSNYNSADAFFGAPAVSAATTLSFTCRATDSTNATSTAVVNATISPAIANALVASIATPTNATPGSIITLDGSATGWFDPTGKASTGGPITYQWTASDPTVALISNPNAAKTNVTFSQNISTAQNVTFTLKATAATGASQAAVQVLVDPFGPFSISVAPVASVTKGNIAVSIVATATSTSPTKLYYQWTQISGPAAVLGGATTSTLGFVPPLVAAASPNVVYVFRAAVGYQPINAGYPGLYTADATVTVTP